MLVTNDVSSYQKLYDNLENNSVYKDIISEFIVLFDSKGKSGNLNLSLFYDFNKNIIVSKPVFGSTFYMFKVNLKMYFRNNDLKEILKLDKYYGSIDKSDYDKFSKIIKEKIQSKIKNSINTLDSKEYSEYELSLGYKDPKYIDRKCFVEIGFYELTRYKLRSLDSLPEYLNDYKDDIIKKIQDDIKYNSPHNAVDLFKKYATFDTALFIIDRMKTSGESLSGGIANGILNINYNDNELLIIRENIADLIKDRPELIRDFIDFDVFFKLDIDVKDLMFDVKYLDVVKEKLNKISGLKILYTDPVSETALYRASSISIANEIVTRLTSLMENNFVYILSDDLEKINKFLEFKKFLNSNDDFSSLNNILKEINVL